MYIAVCLSVGRLQAVLPVSQLAVCCDPWRGIWTTNHRLQLLAQWTAGDRFSTLYNLLVISCQLRSYRILSTQCQWL